jgi:hypothetical protein
VVVTGWNGVEVLGSGVVCRSVAMVGDADRLTAVWVDAFGRVEVASPLGEVGELSSGRTEHGDVSTLGQSREKDHTPKGRDGEMPEPERSSRCPPRR